MPKTTQPPFKSTCELSPNHCSLHFNSTSTSVNRPFDNICLGLFRLFLVSAESVRKAALLLCYKSNSCNRLYRVGAFSFETIYKRFGCLFFSELRRVFSSPFLVEMSSNPAAFSDIGKKAKGEICLFRSYWVYGKRFWTTMELCKIYFVIRPRWRHFYFKPSWRVVCCFDDRLLLFRGYVLWNIGVGFGFKV